LGYFAGRGKKKIKCGRTLLTKIAMKIIVGIIPGKRGGSNCWKPP